MTQNQELITYLRAHGSITRLEAAQLGIMNLWQRVTECEAKGHVFTREDVSVPDRRGKTCHVTRYRLASATKAVPQEPLGKSPVADKTATLQDGARVPTVRDAPAGTAHDAPSPCYDRQGRLLCYAVGGFK